MITMHDLERELAIARAELAEAQNAIAVLNWKLIDTQANCRYKDYAIARKEQVIDEQNRELRNFKKLGRSAQKTSY